MAPTPSWLTSEAAWQRFRAEMSGRPDAQEILTEKAEPWRSAETPSVVNKKHAAPSGDPHDYVSNGQYWWPDPSKPDGLPWIRRDGENNPIFLEFDNPSLEALCEAVTLLILQAQVTGSDAYARAAGRLLRGWFLDEKTRMNPHLQFGQFIPGRCDGRGIGLIDTVPLIFLFDTMSHLEFNEEWTSKDLARLKEWVATFLDWMLTSQHGKDEGNEHNNHGTWYDAQVAYFAMFCGKPHLAQKQIEEFTKKRISSQIESDGSQPHELTRTLSQSYCTFNLLAFACLAQIAKAFGLDLWRWQNSKGASLLSAVHWQLPYYSGEREWTWQQIKPFEPSPAVLLLSIAAQGAGDAACEKVCAQIEKHPWQRIIFSRHYRMPKSQPKTT